MFFNNKKRIYIKILPYIYILPALILVTTVSFIPIFSAIRLSVSETSFTKIIGFAGFKHYISILGSTEGLTHIKNSLIYTSASILIIIPLALFLATLLNRKIYFLRFFRTIIIMPWVVSQTITGLMWLWLINPQYGPLMDLVTKIGLKPIKLLSYSFTSMAALIIVNAWLQYPAALVLNLAGLQTIPKELYEAANVDGASAWTSFIRITLPLIKPTLMVSMILSTILCFNMITIILTFTGGGPFSATETLSFKAFKEAFSYWKVGLGAAYGMIIFCVNFIFVFWYIKLSKDKAKT